MSFVDSPRRVTRIVAAVLSIGLLVEAMVRAHLTRQAMNPDGLSYLEMGIAFFDGDPHALTNGHWSPAYAFILGLTEALTSPGFEHRFAVAQWVNVGAFAFALFGFHYFLRALLDSNRDGSQLPDVGWILLGFGLFSWSSFHVITTEVVTPDMFVAGFVYLATGLVLRIRQGCDSRRRFLLLGAVMGLGYLVKAPLFLLTPIFFGVAVLASPRRWKTLPRAAWGLLAFALLVSPQVLLLSQSKGRLTFGDSGRLNYAWHINRAASYVHWQGHEEGFGTPAHPTRQIASAPAAFEFGSPIGGTYPAWYDPSYWHEGIEPRFDPERHLEVLRQSIRYFTRLLWYKHEVPGSCIVLLLVVALARRRREVAASLRHQWPVFVPGLLALAMYALVHVEDRYIAPFTTLVWVGIAAAILRHNLGAPPRAVALVFVVSTIAVWAKAAPGTGAGPSSLDRFASQFEMAEALPAMGVAPGDKVALLGEGFETYWGHLAEVKVVAEIPDRDEFAAASPAAQRRTLSALRTTTAQVLVCHGPPQAGDGRRWERVGQTDFHLLRLDDPADGQGSVSSEMQGKR